MITSVTTSTHLRVFPRFFLCYRLYFKNMPRETDSGESEKTGCNIISTDTAAEAMDLELNPFIQLGQVIEVTGKTQKGAPHDGKRQRDAGGEFRWAVPLSRAPLPPGKAVITVTAQTAPVG